jgi:hypothetical protein
VSSPSFFSLISIFTSCVRSTSTYTPEATVTVFNNKKRRNPVAAPEPTLEARQVTVVPSAIPAYASPCSGSVRYSSACSCIGVTATVTTAPTPTTVVTAATATSTVVDTLPSLDFTGYGGPGCSGANLGAGSFVAGQCVALPVQVSIDAYAFNTGTCADTASCVLNLYNYGGCVPGQFVNTVDDFEPSCIYVGNAFLGQLSCPNC